MIIGLSLLVGITTTTILFCSHFHQIEGDRAHGKMSPLVRLGGEKATQVRESNLHLVCPSTQLSSLLVFCFL